jgi:hypothetical protein
MKKHTVERTSYRDHLERLAAALTRPDTAPAAEVVDGAVPEQVRVFAEENLDKRLNKLRAQVEFVADALEDLDGLLRAFCRQTRLEAYATTTSDGEQFLRWLERTHELTPAQHDHVACQRARHAVEEAARANRRAHVRFQELRSVAEELAGEMEARPGLRIHLNPLRARARFTTRALVDEEASLPADVLFFPVGNDIRTAVLEPVGLALLGELEALSPCTLGEWAARSEHGGREELAAFCRDLAALGLAAFV